MYDEVTAQLIRGAPTVGSFDAARLPELLTDCYARISAARLLLSEGTDNSDLRESLGNLRQLATALEIHAALAVTSADRESAAFVAASSYQLLSKVNDFTQGLVDNQSRLTAESVPSQIAAGLLFLASGYPADAAEAVSGLVVANDPPDPRNPALRALLSLCTGQLGQIPSRAGEVSDGMDSEARAEVTLWNLILKAIRLLAVRLTSRPPTSSEAFASFQDICEQVRTLSVATFDIPEDSPWINSITSTYAGPHHAATLLLAAGAGLDDRALTNIPDPEGPDPSQWRLFIEQRLAQRPYLWTNHMEAVAAGLLNKGFSASISFPTGAGKSTLSELKIAATAMTGKKVLYLAPTLALVSQVARNLRELLNAADVDEDEIEDQLFNMPGFVLEKLISVMTPERCLLLATLAPDSFSDLGLIVFDECHFLHLEQGSNNLRPISGMLGLLRILELAPEADVLMLSAMMANGKEIADWLNKSFSKNCFLFDAAWKPTRQARGSLVFSQASIAAAKSLIPMPDGRIPQRQLLAEPYAIVCLKQNWTTSELRDYRILRLLGRSVPFKGGRDSGQRTIKLESTACAVAVASAAAARGLKVIVFFHTRSSVPTAVNLSKRAYEVPALEFTPVEAGLRAAASEELGGDEFVLVPHAIAGGHYGDLLREERDVVEGAFKRASGPRILFSTNTLAQGMNLPADLVLIIRTTAYSTDTGSMQNIPVHDLLNAAGRAGRAGMSANGMVLVLPDNIVEFNKQRQVASEGLTRLKDQVLAQDDRCLNIVDPVEVLLDKLWKGDEDTLSLQYFLHRLPPKSEVQDGPARVQAFLAKSFAAYCAAQRDQLPVFEKKVARAVEKRVELIGDDGDGILDVLCSATGLPTSIIGSVLEKLNTFADGFTAISATEWSDWSFLLLDEIDGLRTHVFRSTVSDSGFVAASTLAVCTRSWVTGENYKCIELNLGTSPMALGTLRKARKFCRDTTRELSYFLGLVAQIVLSTKLESREPLAWSASVAATMIREGFDSREKWALFQIKRASSWTRVSTHRQAEHYLRFVRPFEAENEPVRDLLSRVATGVREVEQRA